ncbi:SHOCT domain-containing protein [Actinotalea sp.]|uniref:SHOCT domain-containing protein n=1 Tax=Actinotalea sp. TaxID=1872145 RepID=UPI002CD2FD72|nr:SHOCT domain-containing protein [Actinotalea sp.]HQY32484.1 SHOCT domain-containing protein [Actinotalea sp.]HRA50077.1 SHOCT domain-containing protein [Actinotalea sp.]
MVRRGRPGLLGTMARTAVISSTATRASANTQKRMAAQQQAAAPAAQPAAVAPEPAAAPAPAPAAAAPVDRMALLRELGQLHADGILTAEEFAAEKAKILG